MSWWASTAVISHINRKEVNSVRILQDSSEVWKRSGMGTQSGKPRPCVILCKNKFADHGNSLLGWSPIPLMQIKDKVSKEGWRSTSGSSGTTIIIMPKTYALQTCTFKTNLFYKLQKRSNKTICLSSCHMQSGAVLNPQNITDFLQSDW